VCPYFLGKNLWYNPHDKCEAIMTKDDSLYRTVEDRSACHMFLTTVFGGNTERKRGGEHSERGT
jgi:hypothetical protein